MPSRLFLEAVTVCVNYADFLAETILTNQHLFDNWIIVTSPDDYGTLDLCRKHNLECVRTTDFKRNGGQFNKGMAVERGLGMLAHEGWLLHIDADIALPRDLRPSLDDAELREDCIYGADRLMIPDWAEWQKFKSMGGLYRDWHCMVNGRGYNLGPRWADIRYGYVPIGYFQLWHQSADHRGGIRLKRYPENHQNAARADVKFALQWDRKNRVLLPEVLVAHLDSGKADVGANWDGRTTPPFGPGAEKLIKRSHSPADSGKKAPFSS